MTSNNVNINNKDQGLVELNDITQKVVINTDKNVENVLDIFNRKSLKKNKKNNDFLEKISNIEDLDVFFQNLSKHHLFIRNTLFSKKDVFFEDIYVPLNIKLSEIFDFTSEEAIKNKECLCFFGNRFGTCAAADAHGEGCIHPQKFGWSKLLLGWGKLGGNHAPHVWLGAVSVQ